MARTRIPLQVIDAAGNALQAATVQINRRAAGLATVYATEAGGGTLSNPLSTNALGRVEGWLDRGAYDVVISHPAVATYTEQIDSSPGGDGAIDSPWLADGAVSGAKLAGGAVTAAKIAPGAVTGVEIGTGEILDSHIAGGAEIAISKLALPGGSTFLRADGTWALPSDVAVGDYKVSAQESDHDRWLVCPDGGREVSRVDFADLYAIIGIKFGAGDGATTFDLPDPGGRTIVFRGTHVDVNDYGKTDGVAQANRSPRHNSTVVDPGHSHVLGGTSIKSPTGDNDRIQPAGSDRTGTSATGITVGPGGTRPLDAPAFVVLGNLFVAWQ